MPYTLSPQRCDPLEESWNVSAAARLLEIQRTYLHQKIANLGIRRPGVSVEA